MQVKSTPSTRSLRRRRADDGFMVKLRTPLAYNNFVLYTSRDGIHWSDGDWLHVTPPDCCGDCSYYSNNIVTGRFGGAKRLLIQGSAPYFEARENVCQWWIDRDE